MCPLRLILVFLSATLAGYYAWKSIRSNSGEDADILTFKTKPEKALRPSKTISSLILGGFWGFVDMASGRYLWRNLRVNDDEKEKKF